MGYSAIERNYEGNEMGCDIHVYREKQVDGKWLAADKWQKSEYDEEGEDTITVRYEDQFFHDRNYQLFGLLAKGVRTEHELSFVARGLPADVCDEIQSCAENWGCDGHNHSYLYLHELKSVASLAESATIYVSGMKDAEELEAFRKSISSGNPDWDLLWPYCQWTNQKGHVDFEQEVPANLYFGDSLKKLIAGFDGVDGDNHRIVFFFDN